MEKKQIDMEFVHYEQALALKELDFDEPCFAFYNHNKQLIMMSQENEGEISIWKNSYVPLGKQYAAPTFSQAFRWFREKYKLHYYIHLKSNGLYRGVVQIDYLHEINFVSIDFITCEEAELACLNKLIEIVKTKSE